MKRWRDEHGRLFTWDSFHGEIEVFNKRGKHLGVMNPQGEPIKEEPSMYNFIQNCLTGDALLDEIDEYIDEWHDGDSELPLHDYLGMSWDEYAAWIESPENLTYIITARKRGITYTEALSQVAAMAARSSAISKTPEIENWPDKQQLDV